MSIEIQLAQRTLNSRYPWITIKVGTVVEPAMLRMLAEEHPEVREALGTLLGGLRYDAVGKVDSVFLKVGPSFVEDVHFSTDGSQTPSASIVKLHRRTSPES